MPEEKLGRTLLAPYSGYVYATARVEAERTVEHIAFWAGKVTRREYVATVILAQNGVGTLVGCARVGDAKNIVATVGPAVPVNRVFSGWATARRVAAVNVRLRETVWVVRAVAEALGRFDYAILDRVRKVIAPPFRCIRAFLARTGWPCTEPQPEIQKA